MTSGSWRDSLVGGGFESGDASGANLMLRCEWILCVIRRCTSAQGLSLVLGKMRWNIFACMARSVVARVVVGGWCTRRSSC